ncbi:MAG: aminoglycoside phosphotransferase, partial [[Clostridium] scindens]|nr:aminoglycoside phosphotransferase [[Clostridium] scindens]
MKLENGNLILKRPYKEVYKCDNSIVKVFETFHP